MYINIAQYISVQKKTKNVMIKTENTIGRREGGKDKKLAYNNGSVMKNKRKEIIYINK